MTLQEGVNALVGRARSATMALRVYLVVVVLTMAMDLAFMTDLASRIGTSAYDLVSMVSSVAMLITMLIVAGWIHRAHANLHLADLPDLEFTPNWVIGWYLIPIACLFKPYQAMRELYRNSVPQIDQDASSANNTIILWWSGWVAGAIVGILGIFVFMADPDSLGTGATVMVLLVSASDLVAGWFLIQLIDRITEGQSRTEGLSEVFA
ncbi:DUF4328 domain-containing protein [Altererythrobacter xixiisoli]|uniref:DUF4328 domain-containing protein n=1 Tax=Croceibacterium xixiisoli TaxID=1476466 RepID=A0A6I4TSY7_9SPHN|nr:DUF4328 domain-containing protein [Croceibacterium xixiisoli]MXO98439.1 DUF4328 domain-containing protein [Croceibacterium xixiisoli]